MRDGGGGKKKKERGQNSSFPFAAIPTLFSFPRPRFKLLRLFPYEKGEKNAFSFDLQEGDEEAKFTGWQTSLFVSNKPIRFGAEQ